MKQDQKTRFLKSSLKCRSGQAAVEYILLMVIVVSLIIGMSKVFRTINDGMNHYIGDYVICLMDYGELPSLGIPAADMKKHTGGGSICDAKFAAFAFNEGRPPTGGGAGSSTGKNTSQNSSSSSADKNGSDKTGGKAGSGSDGKSSGSSDQAADDGSSSGGKGGSGKGRSKSPYKNGQINNGSTYGTLDGRGSGADSKSRVIDDNDDGDAAGGRKKNRKKRTRDIARDRLDSYHALSGKMAQEIEKNQRQTLRRESRVSSRMVSSDGPNFSPKRKQLPALIVKSGEEMKEKGDGFSFGGMIRFLMIAGMVVAIVIFFGGQLLNYSNSDS